VTAASKRRRPAQGNRRVSRPTAARPRKRRGTAAIGIVILSAVVLVAALVRFLGTKREGVGRAVEVWWPKDDPSRGSALLAASGIIDSPRTFHEVLAVAALFVHPEPGPHLLRDDSSPAEVIRRLARLSSRASTRVLVPEGWNRFQISERLEASSVCSRRAFDVAVTDPSILGRLGIAGDSAEGFLFPATYELFADTPGDAVAAEMVATATTRLAALRARRADAWQRLTDKYRWSERDVVTLASIVEREAARVEEQPLVASVFFNRLDSLDFKPQRTLQSDPTAGYGCLVHPELDSCRGASGRVTAEMLRDAGNPYNTYRHAGLPPGPIANPGERALDAVLNPAATDFLFFVAAGDGRHTFTRTFEEHEAAIPKSR
jgi:UPF0755 protein